MGFLDRAIKKGIGKGVSDAIGKAVSKVVEPKVTELANRTAEQLDSSREEMSGQTQQASRSTGLNDALQNLQRSAESFSAEVNKNVFVQWGQSLPMFPVWNCGGTDFMLEEVDGCYYFTACFDTEAEARQAVERYRSLLGVTGFTPKPGSNDRENLYKTVDGVVCFVDTEHCFDCGSEQVMIGFKIG